MRIRTDYSGRIDFKNNSLSVNQCKLTSASICGFTYKQEINMTTEIPGRGS